MDSLTKGLEVVRDPMFLWTSDCTTDPGNVNMRNYLVEFVAVLFQFSCNLELIALLMFGNFSKLDSPLQFV